MNYPITTSHPDYQLGLRDLQFAVGVAVAIGGAAVLLSQLVSVLV